MFLDFVWLIIGLTAFSLIIYFEIVLIKKIIKTIRKALQPKNTITNDVPITNNVPINKYVTTETPATTIINSTYIRDNKTGGITRIDKKPISDEEVPYLIEIGTQYAIEREKQSKNPKFHRTEREEELSFQFAKYNKVQIKEHVLPFQKCFDLANEENDLDKKIQLLQRTIMLFDQAKSWFYKTKGGTIYFQTLYENLHNSQCECFSFVDTVRTQMEYYIRKRDYLIPMTIGIINSNSEGILQKDIYKHIPDASKKEVQQTIRELENEGKISKEKSGNSYLLTIK